MLETLWGKTKVTKRELLEGLDTGQNEILHRLDKVQASLNTLLDRDSVAITTAHATQEQVLGEPNEDPLFDALNFAVSNFLRTEDAEEWQQFIAANEQTIQDHETSLLASAFENYVFHSKQAADKSISPTEKLNIQSEVQQDLNSIMFLLARKDPFDINVNDLDKYRDARSFKVDMVKAFLNNTIDDSETHAAEGEVSLHTYLNGDRTRTYFTAVHELEKMVAKNIITAREAGAKLYGLKYFLSEPPQEESLGPIEPETL